MKQQTDLGKVNGYIEETVTGQKVVKVFNYEENVVNEFSELNQSLRNSQVKAQFISGIMGPCMNAMRIDPSTLDLKEKVVYINRVTKVVKGGRNFRFSALVVVGDENGHVGVGTGKSIEIPEAIKKGIEDAKKNMVSVAIVGTTVPHEIYGRFGTGKVLIMPAKEGTGVIAGGPARAVLELAGLKDVRAKSLGSNNPRNMVNATINGLASLRTAEDIAKLRGKTVEEILG